MLRIQNRRLPPEALDVLNSLQEAVDRQRGYEARVQAAKKAWETKTSTKARAAAFQAVRATLGQMCMGAVRCAYCEDSMADEIEHIFPKTLFPERAFVWENYAFVCGPCNGPKSNRHGILVGEAVEEFCRRARDPVLPPPEGRSALIDPRQEDPTSYLELDLGGVTEDGVSLEPTFEFLPKFGIPAADVARAEFTIDVLGLNREVLRAARENAFSGFRARLGEYVARSRDGSPRATLSRLRREILSTPHLTVLFELLRQRDSLPDMANLIRDVPSVAEWTIGPSGTKLREPSGHRSQGGRRGGR